MTQSNVLPNTLLPIVLSGQLLQLISEDIPHDVLIDGIPFRIRPSDQNPLLHQVLSEVKEQFDASREAGENSFGTWWLRSQSTFHGGQGQAYLDSTGSEFSRLRFLESRYAKVDTAGELSIAGTVTTAASSKNKCEQVTWSSVQKLVTASSTTSEVRAYTLPGLGAEQIISVGASGTPVDMTTDGVNVFVAIADKIYRIPPGGPSVHTHNLTFGGPVVMGFAKQRLIVCVANEVFELDPNPGAPPVAVGAAHYTNPSTDYVYTSVAEGPDGIYLSGYSGTKSNVSRMSVTESAGTIVLGPPIVQLELPPNERVNSVFFYLGSQFALATSNGARIGEFTPYAQPVMGPLVIEDVECTSLTGNGTLIWVGAEDSIWWIDLATAVGEGIFAATMYADGVGASSTDTVSNVTVFTSDPDLVFGTTAGGNLISQPTYEATSEAVLTTSWVRFDTTEAKRLHFIAVEGDLPAVGGVTNVLTVVAEAITGETKTFNVEGGGTNYEFSCDGLPTAQAFRLTITLRDAGSGNGVKLRSWQMKALPTPQRIPEVVLPLMLDDFERPAVGEAIGYQGFARDRLLALMALATTSAKVTVVDRLLDMSYSGVISRLQFEQTLAPTATNAINGIINVVLKQV